MKTPILTLLILSVLITWSCKPEMDNASSDHKALTQLFKKWREFENPPRVEGAPDYRAQAFSRRMPEFKNLRTQLLDIDTSGWTIPQKADWMIVWAEMNGFDFNYRVLKPWERDPAFYKSLWTDRSDVPAHEGPTHHATTELWTYQFPLSEEEKKRFLADLEVIPVLNEQATQNLTGNARELWIAGIRDIRSQSEDLAAVLNLPGVEADSDLRIAIKAAIFSTDAFVKWLEEKAPSKTGPSGIGKDQYTWYQQNVHLVPLTWEEEVMLLKRELARAWSGLKLEEHRNRNLPKLPSAEDPEAYQALAERSAQSMMGFLKNQDIVTVKDYFEPALREHLGQFVPKEKRHFFWITAHLDPRPLYSKF